MVTESYISSKEKRRYRRELVEFLKIYADQYHHDKEESLLFKVLEDNGVQNEGGAVGVMLEEHAQGRMHLLQMTFGLIAADIDSFNEAAGRYSALLKTHINKENMILFKLADQTLDDEQQTALYAAFTAHENKVLSKDAHARLLADIDKWAEAYGV